MRRIHWRRRDVIGRRFVRRSSIFRVSFEYLSSIFRVSFESLASSAPTRFQSNPLPHQSRLFALFPQYLTEFYRVLPSFTEFYRVFHLTMPPACERTRQGKIEKTITPKIPERYSKDTKRYFLFFFGHFRPRKKKGDADEDARHLRSASG